MAPAAPTATSPATGAVEPTPASPGEFSAAVSAITSAFGDPTRRAIYLHAHEAGEAGVTAAQVAEHFGLHPNVARHHLDKLAAGGYLEVAVGKPGSGAGRPSKRYRASGERLSLDAPVRADDLVLTLLGRALALLPRAEAEVMAEEVGEEYGRALAAGMTGRTADSDSAGVHRSFRSALHAVADALTAHGFAAHTDSRNNELRIINNHCPFGEVAMEHPVICAVDRGMVKGMLSALYGETEPAITTSLPRGDDMCVTSF
ncbi:MAG TPA: helix-turn-helix domain-containing protein [Acidimicrobiales bacterium]